MNRWFNSDDKNNKRPITPWEKYQLNQNENNKKEHKSTYHVDNQNHEDNNKFKVKFNNSSVNLFIILIELMVVLLIMIYFISPLSKINSIDIVNRNNMDSVKSNNIKNNLIIHKGDSLFKYVFHRRKIKNNVLKNIDQISSMNFKIKNLNSIQINVHQYNIVGSLINENDYYSLLDNGKIVNNSFHDSMKKRTPLFYNFHSQHFLSSVIMKYNNLPNNVKNNIKEIKSEPTDIDPNRIHLIMKDKNQVYATLNSFNKKMIYYPAMSKSMKQPYIINIEVGAYSYPIK